MNITETTRQLDQLLARSPGLRPAFILMLDEAAILNESAEEELDNIGIPSLLATDENGQPALDMPSLMTMLRRLCARDLGLGLGYILTSFMAATNVWVAGSGEQKAQCNALLASKKKIAIAYHELDHGNDFAGNQLTARPVSGGYLLQGHKQVINNIGRAGGIVLQARTSPEQGMRTHSLFLIDTQLLTKENHKILPRFSTQGVRSCQIAGIEFEQCFIPESCLLGKEGFAFSYALTAFQITRALLPGISLGAIDNVLDITTRYAGQRKLYGNNVLAIPNVRSELTLAWLDYALCDNLSYVAARGLHTVPSEMSVLASLCKAQVPLQMRTVLKKLALILGSRYYLREGEAALFEKTLRDYPVVSLGHASSFTCQAAVIPQLPMIFKRFSQPREDLQQSLTQLFSPQVESTFNPGSLKLTTAGKDLLFHSIYYWPIYVNALVRSQRISQSDGELLLQRLSVLHDHCVQLSQTTFAADHYQAFETVQSYAWIQSALATIGRWCIDTDSPFSGDVGYLVTCLDFVFSHLDGRPFYPEKSVEGSIIDYLQSRSG